MPASAPDSLYSALSTPHMMTATTETVLDSVLVSGLVKNEPEDLTGQRQRYFLDVALILVLSKASLCFILALKYCPTNKVL